MKKLLIALLLVGSMSLTSEAAGRRRQVTTTRASNVQVTTPTHVAGHTQGLAQAKANAQAAVGRLFHPGGSFGAGRYEGVGFSPNSAEEAIRACCYWGQKTPIDIGVSKSARGFHATVIYK